MLASVIILGTALFVTTGGAAQALSSQPVLPGAPGANTDSTPCVFNPTKSCGSTDLAVTVDWWSSSGAIKLGCIWNATVNWGDGTPTQSVTITSTATYKLLASHTYAKGGPEVIKLGGTGSTSSCTVNTDTYDFDPGQVCMFSDPRLLAGLAGHVGWAYLQDPSSGTWEFGSNDGPLSWNPTSPNYLVSNTWVKTGTWASVDSTFTGKSYKSVKCLTGGEWDNVAVANSVVTAQQRTKYQIPANDCLSEAVAIFGAYGLSIPSSGISVWIPNYYYNTELTGWSKASLPSASAPG